MRFTITAALAALLTSAIAAKDQRTFAVLYFNGDELTRARVDPIVNFGEPSAHVHTVFGGNAFSMNSTGEDLVKKSTCSNAKIIGDNSNYWFPSLFFQDPKTGLLEDVKLFYIKVYYFFEPTNDKIVAFPTGLSMLTGDSMRRTPPTFGGGGGNQEPTKGPITAVKWTCPRSNFDPPSWPANSDGTKAGIQDPNNKGEGVGFPFAECDGYASPLRADMHFPSCYNPKAGLTNYKENMAWPSDVGGGKHDCPKGWIHTPHLFIEAYWNTPLFKDRWTPNQGSQPFVLSNGDATGYGSHADFMAGWDEPLLQHIIDTCDEGNSGMNKCPGMEGKVSDKACTIAPPLKEVTTGVLQKLPGNNPITGWGKGGNNPVPAPVPSSSVKPSSKPSSISVGNPSKPSSTNVGSPSKPTTTKVGSPSKPSSTKIENPGKPSTEPSSCSTPKTHTSWQTVTVTGKPTATSQPGSSPLKPVGGFKYAGCFKDNIGRVLTGDVLPKLGRVSNANCVAHCKARGFPLAGTEYGGQCYCGKELVGSAKLNDSECKIPCEGDSSSVCGGSWALSVYSVDGKAALKAASPRRRHLHGHLNRKNNL